MACVNVPGQALAPISRLMARVWGNGDNANAYKVAFTKPKSSCAVEVTDTKNEKHDASAEASAPKARRNKDGGTRNTRRRTWAVRGREEQWATVPEGSGLATQCAFFGGTSFVNELQLRIHKVSAYLEILIALERRLDAGCQFHNPRLVHQLRERVFIPETGFVNASKCRWRQFEVQVPGSQDWYDLSEVYGAEVEASQLQRFFVYWLSVPTTLTLDEILEGLRALRSKSRLSRWTGHSQDEGPTLPRAARWYKELGRSLRKAPSSDLQVFRDEALIYVAGTERNWRKAPECLWIKPEKCPEGWSTDREELSAQYGHDPLLKEVFTERLGVPISVRFTCTSDAPVAPVALQGQPLWILDEGEVPEARNFIDTSERRPSNEVITDGEADPGSLDEEPLGTEPTAPVSEGEVSPNPDAADAAAPSPPSPPEPVEPPSLEPEENGAEQLAEPEPPEEAAKRERENTAEDGRRPYVESNVQLRGVAADGREERRRMLERLARSVKSLKDERQMISKANKVKHHSEVCVDCNPHHDLVQVGYLESPMATEVFIPVWVERSGQKSAMDRLKVSMSSQALYRFADLLMAVSSIFSVPCHRQVHIFEEDTQTVAFNSGALFFNLRFFTEECHDQSWEEAVSFWTVSFAHELAHFESPVHDRQHGRAMEMSQRAILPRIPQILARPWGAAPGSAAVAYRTWKLRATDGGLI
ncbi:unnamed protein product [Durusdinium trenchii]|uniref:Uncharacterized protein n=1 Tax=Durusdinium trenchii TaxID=1381693 RepID=A0ABP0N6P0_9DINO